METKKVLTLAEAMRGIKKVVDSNPNFTYPQQDNEGYDKRCTCVEVEQDEDKDYIEEMYIYEDCPWHLDDDNTCRYLKDDEAPACVVGHYFVKELGFDDLWRFEQKAPTFILEAHGYEVEAPADRFLNTMQSQQDQGNFWEDSFETAVHDVEKYFAESEVPYAEE